MLIIYMLRALVVSYVVYYNALFYSLNAENYPTIKSKSNISSENDVYMDEMMAVAFDVIELV